LKRPGIITRIAQTLVVALFFGSMPTAFSPVILQHEAASAFTLNICNPLPSTLGAGSGSLPTLVAFSFECVIEDRGSVAAPIGRKARRAIYTPDPPPPKSLL
jgi:hypothetical protein